MNMYGSSVIYAVNLYRVMNYPMNIYGSSVIYAVNLYRVINYPMNIYGSSVIYAVNLYRVMNYPMNIQEVLRYHRVILCDARTCKVCYFIIDLPCYPTILAI